MAVTVVVALDELFVVIVSASAAVTVAGFVIEGSAAGVGVTRIVIVAVAPEAIVPRRAFNLPLMITGVPWVDAAVTFVTFAGSVSLNETPVATLGPLLATVTV